MSMIVNKRNINSEGIISVLRHRTCHFNFEASHATSLTLVTDCPADKNVFIYRAG